VSEVPMRVLRGAILSLFRALFLALAPLLAALAAGPERHLDKPDAWFAGDEGRRIAAVILSFQSDLGGWPQSSPRATATPATSPSTTTPWSASWSSSARWPATTGTPSSMATAAARPLLRAGVGVPDRHHQR